MFGAVGCQRNRAADGNSRTPLSREVPAFRNVDGVWVGCSVEQRRKAVRAVSLPGGARTAPHADGYLLFMPIQRTSNRAAPAAGFLSPVSVAFEREQPAAREVWQLPG